MTITAAADGSALGNPGPAGWAWFIDENAWRAGGWAHGTNNQGELTAVLELLRATAGRAEERLEILCDSQYVINSVTKWLPGWKKKGWKKRDGKPVLNRDLMIALDEAMAGRDVHFEWVKGHAGHPLNEAADARARAMADAFRTRQDPATMPVGPGFAAHTAEPATADTAAGVASEAAHGHRPHRSSETGALASGSGASPSAEVAEPDLFSELAATHEEQHSAAIAADTDPVRALVSRELAVLTGWSGRPDDGRADVLHEDFECVARDGSAGGAETLRTECEHTECGSDGDALHVVSAIPLGSTAYHVSYRCAERSSVTRRASLWVREDQHNEMGPWLLRQHQVTEER